jgi:hypothetical protein
MNAKLTLRRRMTCMVHGYEAQIHIDIVTRTTIPHQTTGRKPNRQLPCSLAYAFSRRSSQPEQTAFSSILRVMPLRLSLSLGSTATSRMKNWPLSPKLPRHS